MHSIIQKHKQIVCFGLCCQLQAPARSPRFLAPCFPPCSPAPPCRPKFPATRFSPRSPAGILIPQSGKIPPNTLGFLLVANLALWTCLSFLVGTDDWVFWGGPKTLHKSQDRPKFIESSDPQPECIIEHISASLNSHNIHLNLM